MKKLLILILCACLLFTACSRPEVTEEPKQINYKEDSIDEIISNMTLEEKVGQMFIARCPNVDAAIYAQNYQMGGYILFGRDFENSDPETIRETIQSYQDSVKIPMIIAVDEEGETVVRVSQYKAFRDEPFDSPRNLYNKGGMELIKKDAKEKSEFLLDLGINVNFAPVCDVTRTEGMFMYDRSVGLDGEGTAEYVKTVVEEMEKLHMGSVLKHFPGYGDNEDTHIKEANDPRSIENFYETDFLPFQAGIEAGSDIVMISHVIVNCMDDKMPASLSPKVMRILREDIGFNGLTITDELSMGALSQSTNENSRKALEGIKNDGDVAVAAVIAGHDLLCSTYFLEQIPAVVQAVKDGRISEERIEESVRKILQYKRDMKIIK